MPGSRARAGVAGSHAMAAAALRAAGATGGSDSDDGDFAAAQIRRALGPSAPRTRPPSLSATAAAAVAANGMDELSSIEALVNAMRERKAREERGLRKTRRQLEAALVGAADHESALAAAAERYEFLQKLCAYVRDLCACLAHNFADVEALEQERTEAMRAHCESVRGDRTEVRRR
jgi:hypothetical protein